MPAGAHHPRNRPPRGWKPRGSIGRLLQLLVAVPLVAVFTFAGLAFLASVRNVTSANNLHTLVALSTGADTLAQALQAERLDAAVELTGTARTAATAFDQQVDHTNEAIAEFQQRRKQVTAPGSTLRRVDADLKSLETLRTQVRSSPDASLSAITFSYRIVIADLLAFRDSVATQTPAAISDDVRVASAVSTANEAIGQLQIRVLRSLAEGELTPAGQQELAGAQAQLVEASGTFLDLVKPAWVARWEQVGAAAQVVTAQRLLDDVARTIPGDRLTVDAPTWIEATNAWTARLHEIESDADALVASEVAQAGRQQLRDAVIQGIGMLLVLLLTTVLTAAVARRITRRLRSLRDSASIAAYERLPAVVHELNSALPGTVDPEETADRSAAEFHLDGADEIAEVGNAVRALHREAVRIAGEQAVMRANVAEIFVHLSRREQRLVDTMLAKVDLIERDEVDPERLGRLYELDHLATRMARVNQSLLVLGGSGISRVRQEAVSLVDVAQAALSQIEQYTRVRIGTIDHDLWLSGSAVDEVVHLFAELLDNATRYSSPETEVMVTARSLADRAVVQVIDQGVGLSSRRRGQLNAQLHAPPGLDAARVRAMGLTVVAVLAARNGVSVELRAGTPQGTIAEVSMPASVLSREPGQRLKLSAAYGQIPPTAHSRLPAANPVSMRHAAIPGAAIPDATQTLTGAQAPSVTAAPLFKPASPLPPPAAPLFHPSESTTIDAPELPAGRRRVNGWFKTATDGDSVAVIWPSGDAAKWAITTETVAAAITGAGLPRRTPHQHPLTPEAPQPAAGPPRKLDPAAISAAMAAYAKGVAGHRAPAVS